VSVIVPAYRAAHTLARALDSVLGQTCPPAEILVVDDGSPDDVAAAVRPYGERVTLLSKPNGGAASARNWGLDRARGVFVAFLDADDYWEPHRLERQLAIFRAHPEIGVVASRCFVQRPGESRVAPAANADGDFDRVASITDTPAFRLAAKMLTSSVLVRSDVLGEHRFTAGLATAEDRDLWVRLVAAAPVYLTSEPLVTYVEEPGSLSRTNFVRGYGDLIRVIHRHAALLGRRAVRAEEVATYRGWASAHLNAGQPGAALRPAVRRLRRQPLSAEAWWVVGKCLALCCRSALRPRLA
jgi:glycosyltransferase involved in cell wall biosynthesis